MIYRTFGKTGWRVSVVGLGTWNLGNQWGELSDQEATDIILAAIDNGMNLLDAAESYGIPNGMSELRIGTTSGDDSKLVETALRYVISHKSNPVVIPGATKVKQVIDNARAGAALLDEDLYRNLSASH